MAPIRPAIEDQVILITGSTDGIGRQTALEIAAKGARVLVHGRNERKCKLTVNEIKKKSRNESIEYFVADFTSFIAIRNMAREIRSRYPHLDVLLNNAGVYMDERELTEDGFEVTFQVNYLAPFLLSHLLLEPLASRGESRIINVASVAHESGRINFNNLNGERGFDGYDAYAQSKLALIHFTYEMARRLKGSGITVNCLHPGVISTKLLHQGFGPGGASVKDGARTSVYLALSEEVRGVTGRYFIDCEPQRSSSASHDQATRKHLWELSTRFVGLGTDFVENTLHV